VSEPQVEERLTGHPGLRRVKAQPLADQDPAPEKARAE
jgi:hypothetical protein